MHPLVCLGAVQIGFGFNITWFGKDAEENKNNLLLVEPALESQIRCFSVCFTPGTFWPDDSSDASTAVLAGYQQVHWVVAITSQASVLECIFAALLENRWQHDLL